MQEARIEEYKRLIDQKTALRRSNQNPERPGSHLLLTSVSIP
jgi:regulator of nonsense transcripts 2